MRQDVPMCADVCKYVQLCADVCRCLPVCACQYIPIFDVCLYLQYVPMCANMYQYVLNPYVHVPTWDLYDNSYRRVGCALRGEFQARLEAQFTDSEKEKEKMNPHLTIAARSVCN
jgi:hypothetical protein